MATTDVAFSSDSVDPSGMPKNGSMVLHAGSIRTGNYDVDNTYATSGITDDQIEVKYSGRFDDYAYYLQ